MNDLEDQLRDTLIDRAGRAPDGADMLDRVYRRDRQVTLRRRTVLAGALTFGVGAATTAAVVAARGHDPSDTLNPAPTGPPPSERLERANYQVPAFPLTPTWVPPGYHRGPLQLADNPLGGELGYLHGNDAVLSLALNTRVMARADIEAAPHEIVQVNGTPAYLLAEAAAPNGNSTPAGLYWQRRPDQWLGVEWTYWKGRPMPPDAKDTMIRFLAGLVDKPIPVKAPFRTSWTPRHALLSEVDNRQLAFRIPPRNPADARGTFAIRYWVPKDDGRLPADRQPITIRGWKHCTIGTITGGGEDVGPDHLRYMVFCRIGKDRYVNVTAPSSLVTIGDMVAITEGVTIRR